MKANVVKGNIFYFTNLDTVKTTDFEMTHDIFNSTMRDLINSDIDNNYVVYDNESDRYYIYYKGKKYDVYYGNNYLTQDCEDEKTLELLDELVEVSKLQKRVIDEDSKRFVYYDKKRRDALRNADRNVFKSDDDKKAKIEMINKDHKENKYHFFKSIWNVLKFMNVYDGMSREDKLDVHFSLVIAVVVVGGIVGIATHLEILLKILTVSIGFLCLSCLFSQFKSYNGLLCTVLSIISLPINILVNLIIKIIDSIKYKKELNSVKKTMPKEMKDSFNIRKMNHLFRRINVNEIVKYLDKEAVDDLAKGPIDYENTIKYITELKDKILSIKDKSTSDKLAKELFDIVSYYTDSKLKFDDKKNVLSSLVSDLCKRVDEVLREENEKEENNQICNGYIETIDEQRMINAR